MMMFKNLDFDISASKEKGPIQRTLKSAKRHPAAKNGVPWKNLSYVTYFLMYLLGPKP